MRHAQGCDAVESLRELSPAPGSSPAALAESGSLKNWGMKVRRAKGRCLPDALVELWSRLHEPPPQDAGKFTLGQQHHSSFFLVCSSWHPYPVLHCLGGC